jgi:hypothetical protein
MAISTNQMRYNFFLPSLPLALLGHSRVFFTVNSLSH